MNSATKRWRLTIDDNGVLLRTALTLLFSLSFMCGSHAQVRDLVYGTNNVVVGPTNTNALAFTNSVAFSNPITFGTNAATTRTNLGVTVASNLPYPYSGASATNSLLVADGSGSSAFVSTIPKLTIASGTITNTNPALSISQTWSNTSVAFTGMIVNITNTGSLFSGSTSYLQDWQVGGTTVSSVRADGVMISRGFATVASGVISVNSCFSIVGPASGVMEVRQGTSPITLQTYGSYTNSTNYRRLSLGMSNNGVAFIRPESAGPLATNNLIYISGLPTNSAGLPSGVLWNSNGSVVVSP